MPLTRSQNQGGLPLPQPGWGTNPNDIQRAAAAEARARNANANRNVDNVANANANANRNDEVALEVPPAANRNPEVAVGDEDEPNPYDGRNPPYEVWMGIQVCGVHDENAAKSLAKNLFMSNFTRCLNVTKEDIKDTFKTLEKRTVNNIAVEPFIKEKVLAFHYWVKTCIWLNIDPEQVPFPKDNADAILDKSELHNKFLTDASDNKITMKPVPFTKDHKWDEWAKTFEEYLTPLPGSTGIPLACVIRKQEEPELSPIANDKENFISMAKLSGKTFKIDSEKVHICLLPLLTKHSEALSVVKGTGGDTKCGRLEWLALVHHYDGFGMHSQELVQVEATLRDLHYSGENKPHMHWAKFECKLNNACSTIRRGYKSDVDEHAKIRNLLSKIRDPRLEHMHSNIIRASKDPTYTYLDAMAELKEEILRKNPNTYDTNKNTRRVKQATTKKQQNYKHDSNRSNGNHGHNQQFKPRTITLNNGKKIKYHHSYTFKDVDFRQFTFDQKKTLRYERRVAKRGGSNQKSNYNQQGNTNKRSNDWKNELKQEGNRIVQSLMSQFKDSVAESISEITQQNTTPPGLPSSIMGGRNAQEKRNKGGRNE